jgi:hypothetical protein
VRIYTVHLRDGAPPVLLREGFSVGCLLFGPFWLLAVAAWIPGVLALALALVLALILPPPLRLPVWFGYLWLLGLFGQDLRRWSLARRGYAMTEVLAARDADTALGRLLTARPDLLAASAP